MPRARIGIYSSDVQPSATTVCAVRSLQFCRCPLTLPCDSLDAVGATRDRHPMPVAWQTTWMIDGTASILLIVAISSQNFLTRPVASTSTFYFHKPAAVF
jgi:hypothetical protein